VLLQNTYSLHFNLADFKLILFSSLFPVSLGVCTKFYYRNYCRMIVYITYYQEYCISYHESVDILCRNLWRWAIQKFVLTWFCDSRQMAKIWCSRNIHVLLYFISQLPGSLRNDQLCVKWDANPTSSICPLLIQLHCVGHHFACIMSWTEFTPSHLWTDILLLWCKKYYLIQVSDKTFVLLTPLAVWYLQRLIVLRWRYFNDLLHVESMLNCARSLMPLQKKLSPARPVFSWIIFHLRV